jgi:dTMP kinase
VAAERRAAVRTPDRFEQQDTAFFTRVRNGYAQRMAQAPQRFVRLQADADRGAVWAQIEKALEQQPWW